MQKKIIFLFLGLYFVVLLLDSKFSPAISNSSGAPAGYTGSPGDGKTCGTNGGCHGGGATSQTGWVTSNIPSGGYIPGSVYTITATVIYAGRVKFGFEISPQSSSGNLLGSLVITNSVETQIVGTKYITHTVNGTTGNGSRSWSFNWTAPATGTGSVTFYAAFNATNNNFGSSGDIIYTSSYTVQEDPVGILTNVETEKYFSIFPNPAGDFINIVTDDRELKEVHVYNEWGSRVMIASVKPGSDNVINVSLLASGLYFIRAEGKQRIFTRHFQKINE